LHIVLFCDHFNQPYSTESEIAQAQLLSHEVKYILLYRKATQYPNDTSMRASSNDEDDLLYKQQLWNASKNVVLQVEHETELQHVS